jgi:hypothetical protein
MPLATLRSQANVSVPTKDHAMTKTVETRNTSDGLREETVTLASVKACNVWVDWMEKATAGLADEDLVDVVRRDTPFGIFLLAIRPHAA